MPPPLPPSPAPAKALLSPLTAAPVVLEVRGLPHSSPQPGHSHVARSACCMPPLTTPGPPPSRKSRCRCAAARTQGTADGTLGSPTPQQLALELR
eukprot:1158701-Pelagomonas_calceolata.AAC.13